MRTKIYDPQSHCLLYFEKKADEEFWDKQWQRLAANTFANPPRNRTTVRTTRRYLPAGARLLEGGCGLGQVVYALDKAGFSTYGIDFAPKVVKAINEHWPHLDITCGDVRKLPSDDSSYDGYWSFGVIEHFPEGYDDIAKEMRRVIRSGGYLFLSFPSFNSFRKARAAAGRYPLLAEGGHDKSHFYQYALDPQAVQAKFEDLGFELMDHRGESSLKGLAEDSRLASAAQQFLQKLPSRFETAISMAMDLLIGRYAGHSCLLILRKK
jgi:2-polyprenyl-3-methyl-5-hydroxy-6-metoxy-1,4-benzoquinol methylase